MASYLDASVIRACHTLFGSELAVSLDFLRYLEPSGVKSAYRKRALETHPDRVVAFGPAAIQHQTTLFVDARNAHDLLMAFLAARERIHVSPALKRHTSCAPAPPEATPQRQPKRSRFFTGTLPQRHLLFGEYLYYSRAIPQHALIEAIAWQRRQRPRFGDIAQRWHFLTADDIAEILRNKRFGEPLGESAVRLCLLSRFQVKTVLHYQRKNQQPIGHYFTAEGHIMRFMLRRLLLENEQHNEQFRTLVRI